MLKNIKIFYTLLIIFICVGCSNGKLEYRDSCKRYPTFGPGEGAKEVFLINTSRNKKITYTVKSKESVHWQAYEGARWQDEDEIETKTYTLSPGEEVSLSCDYIVYDGGQTNKTKFEIVGELEEK
jgi:hypothetical protein